MLFRSVLGTCCFVLTAMVSLATAQQPALDPAQADADFQVQGEYAGTIQPDDAMKLGIQVIALGGGKFHAVGYHGGLPGDGWDGKDKHEADGELKDGAVTFQSGDVSAVLRDGTITIRDGSGNTLGECKKIVRQSPTLGLKAPAGAVILFDGSTADNFNGGKLDGKLLVQGVTSRQKFQNYSMHLEFLLSYMPTARGQGRGNSGCYAQGRYEVQILDSFGLSGEHNECGGIYSVKKPDVNMCLPPLSWQTYDIDFTAAKYDAAGKKLKDALMTVKHNGVLIHSDVSIPKATTAAPVAEGPEPGPLYLQDHGNPIRFRNIWVVEKN
ncbi:MAG: DUF1080 domain-containing protein [Planctomycetes bacterium]|nr:DUF1080 domain-containing protein [Planctomycetota bacterium]